ncbi:unnamed protein product [Acanthoscelides obtectus]|uniref:Peptidase S1 domain-containing protein n=1 Tax=Acanthoscelides obtectus TaxID=200917 RepID=A0A9P0Q6G2_ACAOB|nr:unnamed protein product [Acanthoscelides obtectus]CAK1639519.1 Serine protease snake [Acanthoscelides obtectus]
MNIVKMYECTLQLFCLCLLLVLVDVAVVFAGNGLFFSSEEGDACDSDNGHKGICKLLEDCPAAVQRIKEGIFPEICGFVGTQSFVCCENKNTPKETEPTSKKETGIKSKEKCNQYGEYAYEVKESPTLTVDTQMSKVLECTFEREPLIVGGTEASRREFPHMAQVGYNREKPRWYCGGTLIAENFVLTAAHCLWHNQHGKPVKVRAGMTNLHDTSNMQVRDVLEVISHPTYKGKYNDIGLLKISSFEMNTYVRPACLHTTQSIPSKRAIASGWGNTEFSGSSSDDLQKVVLEFYSVDKCNQTYRREINQPGSSLGEGIRDDIMVCAGSSEYVRDTCQCNMARSD